MQMEQTSQPQRRHNHKRKYTMAAPVGGMVLILSVVGIIAIVFFSIKLTGNLLDDSDLKAQMEEFISPVVMLDPVPFDSIDKADPVMIINSAMWYTLKSEDTSKYPTDERGAMLLPQSDLEVYAKKLYGKDIQVQHQSISQIDLTFEYDPSIQAYRVPITGIIDSYTPKVEKITHKGNEYRLKVGYIPSGSEWGADLNGQKKAPAPDKYATYVLKKDKNEYYITAIIADTAVSTAPEENTADTSGAVSEPAVKNAA